MIAALTAMLFMGIQETSAKRIQVPKLYIFGFSASFTDSIVYMTDVQEIDSAWIDNKTKFLVGREQYSYQLKNYFANTLNMQGRTCIVIYATKREEAEKKYVKMKRLYTIKAKNRYDMRYLSVTDFRFKPVVLSPEEIDQ